MPEMLQLRIASWCFAVASVEVTGSQPLPNGCWVGITAGKARRRMNPSGSNPNVQRAWFPSKRTAGLACFYTDSGLDEPVEPDLLAWSNLRDIAVAAAQICPHQLQLDAGTGAGGD